MNPSRFQTKNKTSPPLVNAMGQRHRTAMFCVAVAFFMAQAVPAPGEAGGAGGASRFEILDMGSSGGQAGLLDIVFWEDGIHGIACGPGGVFVTSNGGSDWEHVHNHPDGGSFVRVAMTGAKELWAVQHVWGRVGGQLWHSKDGGRTWVDASERMPKKIAGVWDFAAFGNHLYLLGGPHWTASFSSGDAGQKWRNFGPPKLHHGIIDATHPTQKGEAPTVFILGKHSSSEELALAVKRPGEDRWSVLGLPGEHFQNIEGLVRNAGGAMDFATREIGMIGWSGGTVLRTEDGGFTWEPRNLPSAADVSSLWINPENTRHVLASVHHSQMPGPSSFPAVVFETFDGGATWKAVLEGRMQVTRIFALDANRIWLAGRQPQPGNMVGRIQREEN